MGTFWEELGKMVGETAETVSTKASEVMEIQKLKSQIRALEKGNENDFLELGQLVYQNFLNGEELDEEAKGLCEAIQSREESMLAYEKQIVDVKGDFTCEQCGNIVLKGMAYCPYCGMKTPEEFNEEPEFEDEFEEDFEEDIVEFGEKVKDAAEHVEEKVEDIVDHVVDKCEKKDDEGGKEC